MKKSLNLKLKNRQGFSLIEILVAAFVLTIGILSTLQLFIYCSYLTEMSGNTNYVIDQAQAKIDEMRNSAFSTITTNYAAGGTPGNTFTLTNPTGMGVITINASTADLLQVEVNICWKNESNDRVIGEDLDLDGVPDSGEDTMIVNNKIDSPVKLITLIARK